ncbi:hypothetical protein EDC01DRAFT_672929 [Geopyxis carbonaria]|nr:hypothetical protein EDC01DRAFT_672929 [Geopyxis carbonaria]
MHVTGAWVNKGLRVLGVGWCLSGLHSFFTQECLELDVRPSSWGISCWVVLWAFGGSSGNCNVNCKDTGIGKGDGRAGTSWLTEERPRQQRSNFVRAL